MLTLTTEMQRAMALIEESDEHIFITGKAGTGKTTLLKHIVEHSSKNVVVTASTGVAAINARGCTLHSLLNIPLGFLDPTAPIKFNIPANKRSMINDIDVIIIDEISMVRPDIIDYIDRKLRMIRKHGVPFGGIQIVMFGDLFQLPPIVKQDEKSIISKFYPGAYFFYARAWCVSGFHVIELNKVFRQSDAHFVSILNHIREYQLSQDEAEDLEALRSKKQSEKFDNNAIHVCALRRNVQDINTSMLGEPTHIYKVELSPDFSKTSIPCDEELKLRIGARVMMLVNNRMEGYCNGSLGTVVDFTDKDTITIDLDNGRRIDVNRHEWNDIEYVEEDGKVIAKPKGYCRQYPMTLAWAITIHKSQGLTFDNIVIHTEGMFAPGQLYVALSRCTSMEGIVTDSFISCKHIFPDHELSVFGKAYHKTNNFYDRETYKLLAPEEL